jgi:hypothetical protein
MVIECIGSVARVLRSPDSLQISWYVTGEYSPSLANHCSRSSSRRLDVTQRPLSIDGLLANQRLWSPSFSYWEARLRCIGSAVNLTEQNYSSRSCLFSHRNIIRFIFQNTNSSCSGQNGDVGTSVQVPISIPCIGARLPFPTPVIISFA